MYERMGPREGALTSIRLPPLFEIESINGDIGTCHNITILCSCTGDLREVSVAVDALLVTVLGIVSCPALPSEGS